MGFTFAAFVYGRSTRSYQIKRLAEDVESFREALGVARSKAKQRARGAKVDLERAAALAGATDLDELLRQFPSAGGSDPLARKPRRGADA